MKSYQKKYLRGLAHKKEPVVFIGQKGLSPSVIKVMDEALCTHELVKLKFNEFKEKGQKQEITAAIEKDTASELVGLIGHTAIFYRRHPDPEKRKILLPVK